MKDHATKKRLKTKQRTVYAIDYCGIAEILKLFYPELETSGLVFDYDKKIENSKAAAIGTLNNLIKHAKEAAIFNKSI